MQFLNVRFSACSCHVCVLVSFLSHASLPVYIFVFSLQCLVVATPQIEPYCVDPCRQMLSQYREDAGDQLYAGNVEMNRTNQNTEHTRKKCSDKIVQCPCPGNPRQRTDA